MKSIIIIGKRWFERVNGNTYFSAIGLVDGEEKVKIDFEYGYGEQYVDSIKRLLAKEGYLPGIESYKSGGLESLWKYCDRNGITYKNYVSDVNRKKDL